MILDSLENIELRKEKSPSRKSPFKALLLVIELLRELYRIDLIARRTNIQTGQHLAQATWMWPTKTQAISYTNITNVHSVD